MAKLLEGRVVVAHVGCCVFCIMFCVLCACIINYSIFFYFFANQLGKINLDKVQMGKLCTTVNKKPPRKHPDIIRCASVE